MIPCELESRTIVYGIFNPIERNKKMYTIKYTPKGFWVDNKWYSYPKTNIKRLRTQVEYIQALCILKRVTSHFNLTLK